MRGDDLAKLVNSSEAYIDAQRSILKYLARTGAVTPDRAITLRAELDQVVAALRRCHRTLHYLTGDGGPPPLSTAPVQGERAL